MRKETSKQLSPSESIERLVRAVWAAGFRVGKESSKDVGSVYQTAQDPELAWREDVQWRIDTEGKAYHLDISNPDDWDSVP